MEDLLKLRDEIDVIDNEIVSVLKARYEIAKQLLNENREALDRISEFLISKETITGAEFMEIFEQVKKEMEQPQDTEEEEI